MQMNLDPRLDFGIGAPRMSEAAPPNAQQMLQDTKGLLTEILEIENEEEWQASSDVILSLYSRLYSCSIGCVPHLSHQLQHTRQIMTADCCMLSSFLNVMLAGLCLLIPLLWISPAEHGF